MLTIKTFDGNNINDDTNYAAGFTPGQEWGLSQLQVQHLTPEQGWAVQSSHKRKVRTISFEIKILQNLSSNRAQLMRWLDCSDGEAHQFVIEQDSTDMYVMGTVVTVEPKKVGSRASYSTFVVTLKVDGDLRWRKTSSTTDAGNSISAGSGSVTVTNNGTAEGRPVISLNVSASAGDWDYKRFQAITWPKGVEAEHTYWFRLGPFDTRVASTNFAQADGDDIRVIQNGTSRPYILEDINTASTYIWAFLFRYLEGKSCPISASIAGAGTVSSIDLDEDIEILQGWPDEGMLLIDGELFLYSELDAAGQQVSDITRAIRNTSAAAHAEDTEAYFIQHEVDILYGNATCSSPGTPSTWAGPAFDTATSDNETRVFTAFGKGSWTPLVDNSWRFTQPLSELADDTYDEFCYYDEHGVTPTTNVWDVIGVAVNDFRAVSSAWWSTPIGFINITIAADDLHIYPNSEDDPFYHMTRFPFSDPNSRKWIFNKRQSDWTNDTWNTYSYSGSNFARSRTLEHSLWYGVGAAEVRGITIDLDPDYAPSATDTGEASTALLDVRVERNSDGLGFDVYCPLDVNDALVIDTDNKLVYLESDGGGRLFALDVPAREFWLALDADSNTQLDFACGDGNQDLTVDVEFEERYY